MNDQIDIDPRSTYGMSQRYLDFDVVKEVWSAYSLQDGTKIKIRFTLTSVKSEGEKKGQMQFNQQIVALCDEKVCGKPDQRKYTPEQQKQNIDIKTCPYTTMNYEPSEYVLDNGTRVLLHHNVINIARTKLFDQKGDRIYRINVTGSLSSMQKS